MTREELIALIRSASDSDKAPEVLSKVTDEVNSMFDTIENNSRSIAEKDAKITELRDTNTRLFLRVTGENTDDKKDDSEKTPDELLDDLVNKIGGVLNGD